MAKSQYAKLLTEIQVGTTELPNRIIFGSHPTNFARQNILTTQHVDYYRERAKGGAGMIVIEEQLVHPSDLPYEKAPFGYAERIAGGYRRIAEAVHAHGSLVLAQLNHSGMQSEGSTGMHELWAPSPVADVVSREVPKAMEEEDIQAVVAGFVKVAGHVVAGELDGVEINAGQFSLLRQFLSPLTNQRQDQYGGILANRLRFLVQILTEVRQALGRAKILGLRLCADEFAPWGGLTPDDALAIAQEIAAGNIVDYFTVTVGSLFSLHMSHPTYYSEPGPAVGVAARIKQAVGIPVFAEGRIHHPAYAAGLVEDGTVDGVYMNRALIADPDLPRKLAAGRDDTVRACLSCNQGCYVRRSMGKPLSCLVNPRAGVEGKTGTSGLPGTATRKKVLVVGGGPAGLEAAMAATGRGHQVGLWEMRADLGGQMALNSGFPEFERQVVYWRQAVAEQKVEVRTGKQATVEQILAADPDVVILATGAKILKPAIPVQGCAKKSAGLVVGQAVEPGQTILVWDEIGDQLMARAVEKLLAANCKLYFVTRDLFAGSKLASTNELSVWNQRLMAGGTQFYTLSRVKQVKGGQAVIEQLYSGKQTILEGIDCLVFNCWPKPNDWLYLLLKNRVKEVYRIGDCLAPRGIGPAVREGYEVGMRI